MLDKLSAKISNLRNKIAQRSIDYMVNEMATEEYSLELKVLIGLGIEQLTLRQPIDYDKEFDRLEEIGIVQDKDENYIEETVSN